MAYSLISEFIFMEDVSAKNAYAYLRNQIRLIQYGPGFPFPFLIDVWHFDFFFFAFGYLGQACSKQNKSNKRFEEKKKLNILKSRLPALQNQ